MFGVYRVTKAGKLSYLSRSATTNRKLAEELAAERSRGEITLSTGRIKQVKAAPHVAKEIDPVRN